LGRRVTYYSYWENTEPPWDQGDVPWVVRIAVRWAITVGGFFAAEWFVNNVAWERDRWLTDGWEPVLLAAAIYVVLRAIVRPVLIVLTCPLQLLTLGLFLFVVNALIVLIDEKICDWLNIDFAVDGFWPAFVGALVISLASFVISRILRRNPFGPRVH
jgi:putative membrane protein